MSERKAKKKASGDVPKTPVSDILPEQQIVGAPLLGKVKQYDASRREMTMRLEAALAAGDTIRVKGRATDLTQPVERMRLKGRAVQSAVAGETIALEIADVVVPGDAVYKV